MDLEGYAKGALRRGLAKEEIERERQKAEDDQRSDDF